MNNLKVTIEKRLNMNFDKRCAILLNAWALRLTF